MATRGGANQTSDTGHALIAAIEAGDQAAVLELFANGASITSEMLHEPLAVAVRGGQRAMCELLLKHGAPAQYVAGFAIHSRRPEAIELAIELGLATPQVPGWYYMLRSACLDAGRADLLSRWPGADSMEQQRLASEGDQLAKLRSQAADIVFYVRMRHLTFAVRNLRTKRRELSHYEGSAAAGFYHFAPNEKEKHFVAWNEHGVILWAEVLGAKASPLKSVIAGFPTRLQTLAGEAARSALATKTASDWRWVLPSGDRRETIAGGQVQHESELQLYGRYYDNKTRRGCETWPRESYKLPSQVAHQLAHVTKLAMEGPYELTPLDIDWFTAGRVREAALPQAKQIAADLGIRWP